MTNLSVIILVGREERHIRRCLERLAPLEPRQVLVVESQHGDRTHEIAVETGRGLGWGIGEGKGRRKKEEGRSVVGEEEKGRRKKEEGRSVVGEEEKEEVRRKKEEVWKGEEKVGRGGERKKEEGRGEKCGGRGENRSRGWDRRKMAEKKVEEWLAGVDEATFEAALLKLVDEKTAAGEFRFKKPEERELALAGARRFFCEFSRKIIELSDGRCVYFAPDPRARLRNGSNTVSWAEYAFHAVSSSGQLIAGSSTLRERWFNHNKDENFVEIERIIREEHGIYRLIDAHPENDAVIFVGVDTHGGRMEVVSRLDEYGNAEANLGEVTVVVRHKGKKEIPPPKFRPLTEVVEAVAKHQAAGFSPSTTPRSIAHCRDADNGVEGESNHPLSTYFLDLLSHNSNIQTFLTTVWHDWPGTQAAQFDWALDYMEGKRKREEGRSADGWILRLDADEYLSDELIAEIKEKLPCLPKDVDGVVLKRRHMWRDKWVRRGMYPTRILRLFRTGRGKSDGKAMDEHIIVQGRVVEFENDFIDHSLIPLEEWESKHRGYAKREAESFLSGEKSTGAKAKLKWIYYHILPSFLRPWIYYFKRAFISGAYFESPEARDFTSRHALWYRRLVEREIRRIVDQK